jgi:trehalose 6-phosphate phosphatase
MYEPPTVATGGKALQGTHRIETRSTPAADILSGGPAKCALFLDVDGTLLDIAPTPTEVVVPPGLPELLVRISKGLDGALAILTGRQLEEIDSLLAPAHFVGGGVHGAELRTTPGGPIVRVATALPNSLVGELIALADRLPGIIAEPKGPGFAVHYRQTPELKATVEAEIRQLIAQHGEDLVLCPGRKLFEIIPQGNSKGSALETIAALPTFSGRMPIMIGDDVGDVPALAAAAKLGGVGLRVAGGHFGRTDVDLHGPEGVAAWLNKLADRLDA